MGNPRLANLIEGHTLGDIAPAKVKNALSADPGSVFRRDTRLAHIERAAALPMPGAPDEAWRRFDFSDLRFDDLTVVPSLVNLGTAETEGSRPGLDILYPQESVPPDAAAPWESTFVKRFTYLTKTSEGRNRSRANDVRPNKLASTNEAFATRPVLLHIGTSIAEPVVVFVETESIGEGADGQAIELVLPQLLVHLDSGCSAELVFVHRGSALEVSQTKIIVEEGAKLRCAVVSLDGSRFHHDTAFVARQGSLTLSYLSSGATSAMFDSSVALTGPSASADIRGLSLLDDHAFVGQKLAVHHLAPATTSHTRWHSVVRDQARSLFVGTIAIPQGSRYSSGTEESHSILLSNEARAESIPQLEIIENDVECSHGSSVSGLDAELLYYLQSRGIPRARAEALLTSAFSRQILDPMNLPPDILALLEGGDVL